MIQRKQTLFLLSLILMSVTLLFVPSAQIELGSHTIKIFLLPFDSDIATASIYQMALIIINFLSLILSFICIFLYNKRALQLKLSFSLMIIWLAITVILSSTTLVNVTNGASVHNTNYGTLLGIFGMLGSYMAAHYIKKDIELLKSADRIR